MGVPGLGSEELPASHAKAEDRTVICTDTYLPIQSNSQLFDAHWLKVHVHARCDISNNK